MRTIVALSLCTLVLCLTACGETFRAASRDAVEAERQRHMQVTTQQIEEAAVVSYFYSVSGAARRWVLDVDQALLQRVRKVTFRLGEQAAAMQPELRQWKWEVNTAISNEPHAYCMPGGKVMAYTGMIDRLKLTDNEFAGLLAHEIAHAMLGHGYERVRVGYAAQLSFYTRTMLNAITEQSILRDLTNYVTRMAVELPYSQEQEVAADQLGIKLMARAGYDPRAMVVAWRRLALAPRAKKGGFLVLHPMDEARLDALETLVPEAAMLYETATTAQPKKESL